MFWNNLNVFLFFFMCFFVFCSSDLHSGVTHTSENTIQGFPKSSANKRKRIRKSKVGYLKYQQNKN